MWIDKELISDYVALARCCNKQANIFKRLGYPTSELAYRLKRDTHMYTARAIKGGLHW